MGPVRGLWDHVPMARPVRGLGAPEGDLGPLGPRRGHSLLSSRLNSARVWQPYYHGDFELDDVALHRLGVNRLGNVLIPNASYGIVLEKKIQPMLRDLWDSGVRAPSTSELLWELGRRTGSRQSLLWWAWKNRIPVVVPAMFDGAVGYQLCSFWQEHKPFAIDQSGTRRSSPTSSSRRRKRAP